MKPKEIDHIADSGKKVEQTAESAQNVQNGDLIQRKAAIEAMMFQEIVVRYPSYSPYPEYQGKPYFSIKYTKNGQEFIGYSTYKPEVLSEYLKEYFMPSAQPEIIHCKDCKHHFVHRCMDSIPTEICDLNQTFYDAEVDFCSLAERRTDETD